MKAVWIPFGYPENLLVLHLDDCDVTNDYGTGETSDGDSATQDLSQFDQIGGIEFWSGIDFIEDLLRPAFKAARNLHALHQPHPMSVPPPAANYGTCSCLFRCYSLRLWCWVQPVYVFAESTSSRN